MDLADIVPLGRVAVKKHARPTIARTNAHLVSHYTCLTSSWNDELVNQVGRDLEEISALLKAQKVSEDDHRERMVSAAAGLDAMEKKLGKERA